ncbi:unnamed protein product [Chondrus crispus]|uniref:Uncharacterized protein n=1 Tax=Chondrus crispus TaxID=2769 RepID=R7QAF9_CHOCR|nr:unnamed protein product [Chondrus crispus]CDF35477.1 unnamed protein product [Chondrus crispus]|eukprot:XP_005715296.1 unnamed protein product [Chondrus crispus]
MRHTPLSLHLRRVHQWIKAQQDLPEMPPKQPRKIDK